MEFSASVLVDKINYQQFIQGMKQESLQELMYVTYSEIKAYCYSVYRISKTSCIQCHPKPKFLHQIGNNIVTCFKIWSTSSGSYQGLNSKKKKKIVSPLALCSA